MCKKNMYHDPTTRQCIDMYCICVYMWIKIDNVSKTDISKFHYRQGQIIEKEKNNLGAALSKIETKIEQSKLKRQAASKTKRTKKQSKPG